MSLVPDNRNEFDKKWLLILLAMLIILAINFENIKKLFEKKEILVQCAKCKIYKPPKTHCKNCKMLKWKTIYSNDLCSICLDPLNNCVVTSCNHPFHKECIYNCVMKKKECPLCRTKIQINSSNRSFLCKNK